MSNLPCNIMTAALCYSLLFFELSLLYATRIETRTFSYSSAGPIQVPFRFRTFHPTSVSSASSRPTSSWRPSPRTRSWARDSAAAWRRPATAATAPCRAAARGRLYTRSFWPPPTGCNHLPPLLVGWPYVSCGGPWPCCIHSLATRRALEAITGLTEKS
ncbi:unnamed protein product [Phaeothamnion confervicola]